MLNWLLLLISLFVQQPAAPASAAKPALDYDYFKTNVQPIFLATRGEHARCISCHIPGQGLLRLQRLAPGATGWSEEETRKNFDAVSRLVVPGNPERSRLLTHPLATAAGGDGMHTGGKQWSSKSDPEWQAIETWVKGPTRAASRTAARIIQTNSAGTTVSVIDPQSNTVVGVVKGIEVNHGVTAAPDGSRLYITNESESTLDVADAKTFQVIKKIALSGHPNNVSISKDGKRVYVAVAVAPGAVDVIDASTLERVKSIPIQGAVHNTFVTPDGKYVIAGSVAGKTLTAIDQKTEEPAWVMTFEGGVRPVTFETNPDGSTKRMFVQISDFHGFAVVDFATHKEVSRVTFPDVPGRTKNLEGVQGAPAHGIGITPDGKMLWATSKWYGTAFAYSMPDLKPLGRVDVGTGPEWLTFAPDGAHMYVGVAGEDRVSVIDVKAMKETARIPVGYTPKRNITAMLQVN